MNYAHHTREELIAECKRLRASHDRLLAAAQQIMPAISPSRGIYDDLQAAIAAAEEAAL